MGVRRRAPRGHRFAESPILQLALQGWRSRLLGLMLMGAFAALVGRGFYLQIIHTDFLQEKGESRYLRDIEVSASRGKIIDRNGDMLAVSTPMKSVWAIPADARTMTAEQKQQLSRLLEMSVRDLDGKIAPEKTFAYIKRQVSPEVAQHLAALKLPGIHQEREFRRFYPTGDMTAHVVGFTGVDDKGLEGVELAFQQSLVGHSGSRSVIRDRRGNIIEDVGALKAPRDGEEIRLALDSKLQYLAYSQLKAAVAEHKAKAGGVVLDGGGYVNKYVSSFVGFAPVSDPRLIVAVMIDEPGAGQHYGGAVAAPVFSQVMGASLRTLGIPQDAPIQVADANASGGRL
ncbi:hypothetical protein B566_EDAN003368 [Ephemera danica]|nr:hypothetical protein B566_EDAN003368 [Ephemera danica]